MNASALAKAALLGNFSGTADKGYTYWPQGNLLPGIDLATIEGDLRGGDGDELRMKFCAVHSSCALAVNCFAPFKVKPSRLRILGKEGASKVEFEHKLEVFDGRTGPNLDVWIEFENEVLAVESKLLEYLTPKKPEFSLRYESLAPPNSDPYWWNIYQEAKGGMAQHLDRAQLVKHYFGLNKYRHHHPQRTNMVLLYIFWEPLNPNEVEACRKHKEEVATFAEAVADSQIRFRWMTYNDLWKEWSAVPDLAAHAQSLKARYEVYL